MYNKKWKRSVTLLSPPQDDGFQSIMKDLASERKCEEYENPKLLVARQKQIEQNQRHRANADDAKEYALREEAQRKARLGLGSQRVNVNHPGEVSALWWLNMSL